MASATHKTSVCIISDNRLFAEVIRSVVAGDGSICIVGVEGDATKTLEMVRNLRPEVIVVEESNPGLHGSALRAILQEQAKGRVVLLDLDHDFMTVHDWRRILGTQPADFLKIIRERPETGCPDRSRPSVTGERVESDKDRPAGFAKQRHAP